MYKRFETKPSLEVGHASDGTASIQVETGAEFINTGTTTINKTGKFEVLRSGTFSLQGNVIVDGGTLETVFPVNYSSAGDLIARSDGRVAILDDLRIGVGRTYSISSGARLSAVSLDVDGNLLVDGIGGKVIVQNLTVAAGDGVGSAQVTVRGEGSNIELRDIPMLGGSTLQVGRSSGGSANVSVLDGASIKTGFGPATVSPTGTIDINDGAFVANGDLTLDGGTLNLPSGGTLKVLNNSTFDRSNGTFNWFGGKLEVDGVVLDNLENVMGIFGPGGSVGAVTITGDYTQDEAASLEIEIGGTDPGLFDVLEVMGDATMDGNVIFQFVDGFSPSVGDTFAFMNVAGLFVDNGLQFQVENLEPGLQFSTEYDCQTFTMTALTDGVFVPPPGDFNGDGVVDAADYTVWRDGLGTAFTPADYDVWKANFGTSAASGAAQHATWNANFGNTAGNGADQASSAQGGIPEPATAVLLVLAAVGAAMGWSGRGVRFRLRVE